MRHVFSRQTMSVVLALAGVAAIVYGAQFHCLQVQGEKDVQETKRVPVQHNGADLSAGGVRGSSAWGVDLSSEASTVDEPTLFKGEPAFTVEKVTRVVPIAITQFEPSLVRELTVGGVALKAGELRRTYRGDAPLLCPT